MKAILKFDLLDIDDRVEHERCLKAKELCNVIWEFTHNSRKKIEQEFEVKQDGVDEFDAIERCFEHFYSLLEDSNININNLYE